MAEAEANRAAIVEKLYSAVLSDVLDGLGYRDQAMRPFVRPLDEALVLFGRARTGLYMPRYHVEPGHNPYAVEIALVDDLRPGDVAVFACNVTDGLVRDVRQIREMGFPVFAGGIRPLDSMGRGEMMAKDVPVVCGGVSIAPGDLIFGDVDGVVVLPKGIADEALRLAFAKIEGEDKTRQALLDGRSLADAFREHGIL
jgi:4-hydroxy-4-methyl-2-oxoglutarate aldolase